MNGKNKLSSIKHLFLGALAFLLSVACQNDNKPTPAPEPAVDAPNSTTLCVPSDIAVLRQIASDNPKEKLFEGENPQQWKGIVVKWVKTDNGQYAVQELLLDNDSPVSALNLTLDATNEDKRALPHLKKIDFASKNLSKCTVKYQPLLESIRLNGQGMAPIEVVDIQCGKALKTISIEALTQLSAITIGGDSIQVVRLEHLPRFVEQSNLSFRPEDAETNTAPTTIKELIIAGDMHSLNGLYLGYLELEKCTLLGNMPNLESLTLDSNNLKGTLEIPSLPKLKSLYVSENNIAKLSVTDCPELTELDASTNPSLETVSITKVPSLRTLDLNRTALKQIDLSEYTALANFSAYNAALTEVKMGSQNKYLNRINVSDNQLERLDFASEMQNFLMITLNNNKVRSLDLSRMVMLERVLANDNALENFILSDEPRHTEKFVTLEIRNNHLSAKKLQEIERRLSELNLWEVVPQSLLGRVNTEAKTINAAEEINDLKLSALAQKHNGTDWVDAPAGEYTLQDGIFTFSGQGKYRVICTSVGLSWKFDLFGKAYPYLIGEISL